jgi:hypothetical protein
MEAQIESKAAKARPRWRFTQEHYGEIATWTERVALLLFGSLVVQSIVGAFSLAEPIVLMGAGLTAIMYYLVLTFLHKS